MTACLVTSDGCHVTNACVCVCVCLCVHMQMYGAHNTTVSNIRRHTRSIQPLHHRCAVQHVNRNVLVQLHTQHSYAIETSTQPTIKLQANTNVM